MKVTALLLESRSMSAGSGAFSSPVQEYQLAGTHRFGLVLSGSQPFRQFIMKSNLFVFVIFILIFSFSFLLSFNVR